MPRLAAMLLLVAAAPAFAAPSDGAPYGAPIVAWNYTVREGDSFLSIARRMGVTMKALAEANAVPYPYTVRTGQVLKRPGPAGAPVPVASPAPRSGPRAALPVRAAPAPRPLPEPLPRHDREMGAPRLSWPTSGAVIGRFGVPAKGRPNNGMDLAAFAGMTVHAAAAGRVLFAGTEPERFGQLILIDHGGGWVTAYGYLGKVAVTEGQAVAARQVIARIGATGEAMKPTLHFEVRKDNAPRDPYTYLPVRL
ncbi:M23 family metallopeptidase [Novosphingobium sp. KCTC 2891]|uniref:M23 family metallopeptidase n=1 Tax=Novosphingobium sp. KCTC 2891 TaxID=2989730 RepID=UPI0022225494|nr:M23 family metallopeptidase [Novosphingobium sp. KCTC 2891]MCW1383871.1 M23 family metallopeptidase [Novosphingobium sp. KCTC 2891]